MPRQPRLDAPGLLHHVMARGIEGREIFKDDQDRCSFSERLAIVLEETQTQCYGWALIPNNLHLLLRTGPTPLSKVMRRLMTGYAVNFNKRHRRHGHLFLSEPEASDGLAVVRWCLNPSVIAAMDYARFAQLVAPHRRSRAQQERLTALWQKARDSIGCEAGEALAFEATVMVETLEQIRDSIRATEEKIEEICLQFPAYHYLLTIPGFGPDVSSKVLSAIGNPFRFTTGAQALKMAGLDLSADRSGDRSDAAIPVLSKKGKADLRYALYQAALIASTKNRYFVIYFTNKLRGREREKGITTKMRVKLTAKLLIIAWTLMKKKGAFNPEHLTTE